MLEMKITITAPDLAAAINNLANTYAKNSNGNPVEKPANVLKSIAEETKAAATQAVTPPQSAQAPQMTAAPVTTAPIANPAQVAATAPVNPTPASGVPLSATPAQTPAPVAFAANPVPVPTAAPQYTLEMLATAGSSLIDAGKLDQLMALLSRHGVDSLTNLKPEEYGAVATELRAMGARI